MARAGIGRIVADRVPPKAAAPAPRLTPNQADRAAAAKPAAPARQSMAISADAAERRINTARNNAIAEIKKSPTSADAAERRVQNAVNKEIASITGKKVTQPKTTPTTNVNRPSTTANNNRSTTTSNNSGNQSNSGNQNNNADDNATGSSQSATPASSDSSSGSSGSTADSAPAPVKSAPIEAVLFNDESFSEDFIVDVLFEDLVGQELLSIARNDTVNGQEVIYQPIKNLGLLQNVYNPANLLGLTETSSSFFSSFSIQISEKIPTVSTKGDGKNYYIDETNGDLVIELINMQNDDQVEIQLATSGTIDKLGI